MTPLTLRGMARGTAASSLDSHGLSLFELLQYVPLQDPVKISRLKISMHQSRRVRNISVTAYVEWVLGVPRAPSAPFVVTEIDPADRRHARAQSVEQRGVGGRVSLSPISPAARPLDRRPHGFPRPQRHARSAGGTGARSPLQSGRRRSRPLRRTANGLERRDGERPRSFSFSARRRRRPMRSHCSTNTAPPISMGCVGAVRRFWDDILEAVQVTTPDRSMDILLNRWLLYQTLACRVWARSGVLSGERRLRLPRSAAGLMRWRRSRPDDPRASAARRARQFVEGDVQHWWLPHSGQGVRTRVSDDRVWLPMRRPLRRGDRRRRRARREASPFSTARSSRPARATVLPADRSRTRPATSSSIAHAPSTPAWRWAFMVCR